ncbi:MAG: lipoprotein signal peptidase [Prevotella sp.]|nr:lipoprotein signal peptidase [Prevotella sp.]
MKSDSRKIVTDGRLAAIIVVVCIIIDQAIKFWVKTNMCLHESIRVFDWFFISFIENNGMAYGMQLGSKLLLSVFRVFAIGLLAWYIWSLVRKKARTGYVISLAFVLAGAAGNLIDCMFYGLIFDASAPHHVSTLVDFGSGYAPFLMGKVVDMFYFPLIVTTWPDWVPVWGGDEFIFFSPVFNFADACISVSVVAILLFYRKEISEITFKSDEKTE